jgi:hypothetical protein
MVAVIHTGRKLRRVLSYNEHKVKLGLAACLEAAEYPKDAGDLNFHQKLSRLKKLTELNQQTKVNSVHISLNFDPGEQLSAERLKEIAAVYMDKIGFGGQPYLLYQHFDAEHPHIHLVTTNIKPDGKRIGLPTLGTNRSQKACKEIQIAYGLVKAEESKQRAGYQLKPVDVHKVVYSRTGSKSAMGDVIAAVVETYSYGSLPELNAILQLYNVCADRGSEDSRMFRYGGLVYRLLDERGNKVGTAVKASDFHFRPTLKYLTEKFSVNAAGRGQHKARLRNTIDLALLRNDLPLTDLIRALQKEGVYAALRQNPDGVIDGITYVDHRSRCVFGDGTLGKPYSAKALLERFECGREKIVMAKKIAFGGPDPKGQTPRYAAGSRAANSMSEKPPEIKNLTGALSQPEEQPEQMDLLPQSRRKKRKGQRMSRSGG